MFNIVILIMQFELQYNTDYDDNARPRAELRLLEGRSEGEPY